MNLMMQILNIIVIIDRNPNNMSPKTFSNLAGTPVRRRIQCLWESPNAMKTE